MKRKLYDVISATLALVMCIGCLSGCTNNVKDSKVSESVNSSSFEASLDESTSGKITVLGNYDNFEALDAAILSFNEYYPNAEIVYEKLDDYNNNIAPRVAEDSGVGLLMINRYNFIGHDDLLDNLVDISAEDINLDGVDKNAYKGWYIDEKLFGVPLWYRYYGLVVNKDIVEKENIEIPENVSELYSVCDKLIEKGYVPVQQNTELLYALYIGELMNNITDNYTEEEISNLMLGTEGSSEKIKPVFESMIDMLNKGYISMERNAEYEDGYNDAILKFYEGDTPFIVATSQTVSGMKKRETLSEEYKSNPFEYEFIYSPTAEDGAYIYKGGDTGFAINKNCENYDLAVEFYRYIYSREVLDEFGDIKGAPSTAVDSDNELYVNLKDSENNNENIVYAGDIDDPKDIIIDVFTDVCEEIFSGNITTADDAAKRFEELARSVE